VEIVQTFFPRHPLLEARLEGGLALHLARPAAGGEPRLLTTRLEELDRLAHAELADAELDDDAAEAYAVAASTWARPRVDDRRIDHLPGDPRVHPPRAGTSVEGHLVVYWVISAERLVRRTVELRSPHWQLEITDDPG
jgi:hypothetical protein